MRQSLDIHAVGSPGGGQVKRKLLEHMDLLRSSLATLMTRKGVTSHEKLLSRNIQLACSLSKYIRINEIAMPIEEAFKVGQEVHAVLYC